MRERIIDILIADDSEDDVVLLQDAFEQARLVNVLQVVEDGEQALAYLRREDPYADARRPALVLLDINMPRVDGFEVLAEMKRDPALAGIPVVMLTTSSREEDVARSYQDGACSFISKPVGLDRMREVISSFVFYWALVSRIPE